MIRFWSKVDKSGECWEWTAYTDKKGYGSFRLNGKIRKAHRVAYELIKGKIPDGLVLDHLCRNTSCVNPNHLEPVTNKENVDRGISKDVNGRWQKAKTHCPNGHEYTPENTYYRKNRSHRECKSCIKIHNGKRKYK